MNPEKYTGEGSGEAALNSSAEDENPTLNHERSRREAAGTGFGQLMKEKRKSEEIPGR
jgi:hypothetical protein